MCEALITDEGILRDGFQATRDHNHLGYPSGEGYFLKQAVLDSDKCELLIVKVHVQDHEQGKLLQVINRLTEHFEETNRGGVFCLERYIGLLLKRQLGNERVRKEIYREIAVQLQSEGIEFSIVSAGQPKNITDIGHMYQKAVSQMHKLFFYEGEQIVTPDSKPYGLSFVPNLDIDGVLNIDEVTDKLYLAIDMGNSSVIAQLVSIAGLQMIRVGCSEIEIKSHFVQMVTGVMNKLVLDGSGMQVKVQQGTTKIPEIFNQIRYNELEKYVITFLCDYFKSDGSNGAGVHMKRMIELIDRNYAENLKLETLAKVFNYNTSYLGSLFKKTTGELFKTYLDKVRIDKAKKLLTEGMKVYQVSEEVGYRSADYFNEKFKKHVGCTPIDYRKKMKHSL